MQRLESQKGEHKAAHMHLSDMKPYNRREHHLRAVENSFENLIKTLNGQLFLVKNSGMFFFFKKEAQPQAETVI